MSFQLEPDVIKLRISSLPSYLGECQLRSAVEMLAREFEWHGFQLRRRKANMGALIGSGLHGAAEVALKEKIGGTVMPTSAMQDAAIESFRARKAEEAGDTEIVVDQETPDLGTAEKQIKRMAARYREDVVKVAEPVFVERRIEIELMPGIKASGQLDLLHVDRAEDDSRRLRDLKTSRHKAAPMKFAAQLGGYSLLLRTVGQRVDKSQIDHLARVAMAKDQPGVQPHELPIANAEAIAFQTMHDFGRKALEFAANGDPRIFLANPASRLCHNNFCRAWGTAACPATRGMKD